MRTSGSPARPPSASSLIRRPAPPPHALCPGGPDDRPGAVPRAGAGAEAWVRPVSASRPLPAAAVRPAEVQAVRDLPAQPRGRGGQGMGVIRVVGEGGQGGGA